MAMTFLRSRPAFRTAWRRISTEPSSPAHFIRKIIMEDVANGKHGGMVKTRFPPEPNGHLHLGHAKAIALNFDMAREFGGDCRLRFDDTNPENESPEFVASIQSDIRWLGYDIGKPGFTSDHFDAIYEIAIGLITDGKAYVCSLTADEVKDQRGSCGEAGVDSPYRDRSVEENLQLFREMRDGKYPNGAHSLRARIDMASSISCLRDPPLYRIRHVTHHQTGDKWCIYPLYDFAHCLGDALEGITHSLCTLEFDNNRALYDWVLDQVPRFQDRLNRPRQIEYSRLQVDTGILSKRKLTQLIQQGTARGWDDPRLLTLQGLRARGYTPESLLDFCRTVGVTRDTAVSEIGQLHHALHSRLNVSTPRAMCVTRPLRLVLTDYADDQTEFLDAPWHPQDPSIHPHKHRPDTDTDTRAKTETESEAETGTRTKTETEAETEAGTAGEDGEKGAKGGTGARKLTWSKVILVEASDFALSPPKKWRRLALGEECRLRYGYVVRVDDVVMGADGQVVELRCSHDRTTLGKQPEGRKVKGVIHWVSAVDAVSIDCVKYTQSTIEAETDSSSTGGTCSALLPETEISSAETSLETEEHFAALVEPSALHWPLPTSFQFEREGFFHVFKQAEQMVARQTLPLRNTYKPRRAN